MQGFELDDVHRAGVLHVGAVVIPALLPLAERKAGMSGKEFLTAAVAGYEIGPRVGLCMGPSTSRRAGTRARRSASSPRRPARARSLKLDVGQTVTPSASPARRPPD